MSNSDSELSENSYPTDTPEMQQLRQQAGNVTFQDCQFNLPNAKLTHQKKISDLVIQGFDSLAGYEFDWPNTPADPSIDRLRSKKDLLTQLHSDLLPTLEDQLGSLSKVLNRSDLRQDPAKKLALILEIQPQISLTLEQTIRIAQQITPGPVPKPFHRSDQHFEDFKCFRLHGLDEFIRDSLKNGFESLRQKYRWVTEEPISPTERYIHLERVDHNPLWWSITRTTVLLKGSELDIICGHWLHEGLEEMVYELEDVTRLADPRRIHNIDTSEGAMQGLSNAAIKLSKPFILIVKLSRLFFVKISRQGRNIDQAPSFTEMSSDQFNVLKCSATKIGESMSNLVHLLIEADIDDRPDTSRYLIKEIEKITPLFPSYVALLMLYIVPFFPDTNGLSPQIYFRDWFVSWNTSFSVATYNAIQAVQFFEQDEP
ncbi:hypothetical protein PSHT_08098 [Puccinia striiformis]|uniref:Uncharacterized protein n=1 Tax=Puccinia striiformis TaxID=27350 RepID=A0A2S4VS59_9BASI|nr:hypothetical protein PSHT_08098 [Puccinia striiformis]